MDRAECFYKIDPLLTQHRHVPVARFLGPLKVRLEKFLESANHSADEVRSRVKVLAMAGRAMPAGEFETAAAR